MSVKTPAPTCARNHCPRQQEHTCECGIKVCWRHWHKLNGETGCCWECAEKVMSEIATTAFESAKLTASS